MKVGPKKRRGYTIDQLKELFVKHNCILLENEYKNNKVSMHYICKCGKLSKVCLSAFLLGKRCMQCGIEKHKKPLAKLNFLMKKKCASALGITLEAIGIKKNTKTSKLLGYGVAELREHITNHPNWEQLKDKKWHLDHIFPISAFVEHNVLDLKIINCLENLQPLSPEDNMSKKNKYDKTSFQSWLLTKGIIV